MSYNAPTSFGLTQAHLLADQNGVDPYKPAPYMDDSQWWGASAVRPSQTQWTAPSYNGFQYQTYAGADPTYRTYAQDAPVYQGLNGDDYDRYENALRTSGEQQAQKAYSTAKRDMADAYTARGMYGSSQYTRQMDNQVTGSYMDALTSNAANATAKRYSMEQGDKQYASNQAMQAWSARLAENQAANQNAYNIWQARLGENTNRNNLLFQDNLNANRYNYTASQDQRNWNDYQSQRQVDFSNALAKSKQDWDTQHMTWDAGQNDAAWKRTFDIWSQVDPEVEHWNKKLLKNQANQSSSQGMFGGSLGSALGGLAGGLIGAATGTGALGFSLGSSLGSAVGGGVGSAIDGGDFRGLAGAAPRISSSAGNIFQEILKRQ